MIVRLGTLNYISLRVSLSSSSLVLQLFEFRGFKLDTDMKNSLNAFTKLHQLLLITWFRINLLLSMNRNFKETYFNILSLLIFMLFYKPSMLHLNSILFHIYLQWHPLSNLFSLLSWCVVSYLTILFDYLIN